MFNIVSRWVDGFKSQAAAARFVGISPQALNDQMNSKKPFSEKVLTAAGLRRVVTVHYELIEEPRS
ncbi:hypothetical protein [Asaia astilbis]